MNQATKKIYTEAIQLPPIDRAELLEQIIESFDIETNNVIQEAWAKEAERRLALHTSGDAVPLSEEEVFSRIDKGTKK